VGRYQKGKTNLDFTEARDSEWQWHQLKHMQVCTSLQTDNHANTPPLSFLQAGCPSCRPTNSVKALKAIAALEGKMSQGNAITAVNSVFLKQFKNGRKTVRISLSPTCQTSHLPPAAAAVVDRQTERHHTVT